MRGDTLIALLMLVGCSVVAANDLGRRALLASSCPELDDAQIADYNTRKRANVSLACFECSGDRMLHCSSRTDGLCIYKNGVSCFYKARACKPTDEEVLGFFAEWNAALAKSPEEVAKLYTDDAVLLPTVSNQVRSSQELILDYFEHFLVNKPQGIINSYNIRHLANGVVQNTGIYTFYLSGNRRVQARYSYTYERMPNGKWLIVEHHSSALPETTPLNVTAPTAADIAEVKAAFDFWNAALNKTAEDVADCYAPDAVLLPTVSNKVRNSRAEILAYFRDEFLPKKPFGNITYEAGSSPNIRFLEPNVAINSGVYVFRVKNVDNTYSMVPARYTFVYQKVNNAWLIKEHHSSVMPEPASGRRRYY